MKPPEQAFSIWQSGDLVARVRNISGAKIRLEDYANRGGLIYSNFVQFRFGSGPLKVSEVSPASSIKIEEYEFFGEDTACLYDPQTRFAVLQYNHYGPKAAAIEAGLAHCENGRPHLYKFAPKLSSFSEEKIRNLHLVSQIEATLAIPDLANMQCNDSRTINDAIDIARSNGAQTITLTISNRTGLFVGAKDTAVELLGRIGIGQGVTRLKLKAQVNEHSPREPIDLISERLSLDVDIQLGPGRRYPLADRWRSLEKAYGIWQQNGYLI